MSNISEFNRLIGQRIKEMLPIQTFWAVCKSVDWDEKTMVAIGQTDELEYEEVILGNGSIFKKPAVDSICLLGIIENNGAIVYLIEAEKIEDTAIDIDGFVIKIDSNGMTINGNNFGGIVKANEMKTQIDKNTEVLHQIQFAFQSWITVPNDGGAALKTLAAAFTGLPRADLSGIENNKVKHG